MARLRSRYSDLLLSYGNHEDANWREGESFAGFFEGSEIITTKDGDERILYRFTASGDVGGESFIGKRGKGYKIFESGLFRHMLETQIPETLEANGLGDQLKQVLIVLTYHGKHPMRTNPKLKSHNFSYEIDDSLLREKVLANDWKGDPVKEDTKTRPDSTALEYGDSNDANVTTVAEGDLDEW